LPQSTSRRRNQRRKEDRPDEITEAALNIFAEKGVAATRVDDVARKAGVSKGLLYLYFKTKEEILKAVIKRYLLPKVDELETLTQSNQLTTEEFLRGPFLSFVQHIPHTPAIHIMRIVMTEGHHYPKLMKFYWENVISRAMAALQHLLHQGSLNNEYPQSKIENFPQLLVAPVLLAIIWNSLFDKFSPLDSETMIATHVDTIINSLKG
jgi:AcrR family transcriptional regulator